MMAAITRNELLNMLKGKIIVLPDLEALVGHWPRATSKHEAEVRKDVDERMQRLFTSKRLQRMMMSDFAAFASSWWPYAPFEQLRAVTHFSTWLFAWDDDSAEYSDLILNIEKANHFREKTKEYIHACLLGADDPSKVSQDHRIMDFASFGALLRKAYTSEQAMAFYEEMTYFIESTQIEQELQSEGQLPSVDDYIERRMGSSAVRVCLALTEFAYDIRMPREIMVDEQMHRLWDATNIIISLTNDILSIKKEVAQGQVDTIIPLLFLRERDMNKAVEVAIGMVKDSVQCFDDAAKLLIRKYGANASQYDNLRKFINGAKYACTGNLSWSLQSERFRLGAKSTRGGLRFDLDC